MSHNTWIHRIARATIVRPLVKTSVTPNQITTARLITGLGAAGCLAIGGAHWTAIGGGVFLLSMIFDRADGDLARLTGRTSPGGHVYDLIADGLCNALIFVGLGIGLRNGAHGISAITLGALAGAAVAGILYMVMRVEQSGGPRAAELGGFAGFDPDDAMLVVPVTLWGGWPEELLIAAAFGAPVFALLFAWRFRRELRERDA